MFFGPIVDEDTQGWVIDSFEWAIENGLLLSETQLIAANAQNFPAIQGAHEDVSRALVEAVQRHLGIVDQIIAVRPLDVLPPEYRYDPNAMGEVAGTWDSDGSDAVVTYDPAQQARPLAFLSTMVHEVMHHRLHMTALDMPGGFEAEELSTDLQCITAGFGAIQMSGAEQAGWQGYLRQETRAFAMAVFMAITGTSDDAVRALLPKRSFKLVRKAAKLLDGWSADIADLRGKLGRREIP